MRAGRRTLGAAEGGGVEHVSLRLPSDVLEGLVRGEVATLAFGSATTATLRIGNWCSSGTASGLTTATRVVAPSRSAAADVLVGPVVAKLSLVAAPADISASLSSKYRLSSKNAEAKKKDDARASVLAPNAILPSGRSRKRKAPHPGSSAPPASGSSAFRSARSPAKRAKHSAGPPAGLTTAKIRDDIIHLLAVRPMSAKRVRNELGIPASKRDLCSAFQQAMDEVAEPHPVSPVLRQLIPAHYAHVRLHTYPYTSDQRKRVAANMAAHASAAASAAAPPHPPADSGIGVQPSLPSRRATTSPVPARSLPPPLSPPPPPHLASSRPGADAAVDSALVAPRPARPPSTTIDELAAQLGIDVPPFPSADTMAILGALPPKARIAAERVAYPPIASRHDYRRYKSLFKEKLYPLYAHLDADLSANTRFFDALAARIDSPGVVELIKLVHAARADTKDRLQAYFVRLDAELRDIKAAIQAYVDSIPA